MTSSSALRLTGVSVLAAEDNLLNQCLLEGLLQAEGAQLTLVSTGREAVERIEQAVPGTYDIVLMDMQMPEMDGYEAARRILAIAPTLPIVGQTAQAMNADRDRCLAAGMCDHLTKPLDLELLIVTLLKWLPARAPRTPTAAAATPAPAPSGLDPLADPDVIDLRVLAQRLFDDPVKVQRLARLFVDTAGQTLAEMDAALARADAATLKALAHRMRSGALAVGALRYGELCRQIETGCACGPAELAREPLALLHALHVEIARRLVALTG
ncbi:MAG: response regulator [Burkholderiales bacterium]